MGPNRTQPPPAWGTDPLSEFMDGALANTFATFANKKKHYDLLSNVDSCFCRAALHLSDPPDLTTCFLLFRCHSAYRAACRLAVSGQAAESFVILRSCLEYSLYALHMYRNPRAAEVWLQRHDNHESTSAVKLEFTTGTVMTTLKNIDVSLHSKIKLLYDRSVDYGAHPNERAVTGSLKIEGALRSKRYLSIYCHGDGPALEHALKTSAQIGLGSLLIFRFIFPDRFAVLGISERIDRLRQSM